MKKKLMIFLITALCSGMTVNTYAGETVLKSNIAVLIDDMPVRSVIIDGGTYINIGDLKSFGIETVNSGESCRLIYDDSEYTFDFLPSENINILKRSAEVKRCGSAEHSELIFSDETGREYTVYKFNGEYLIKLRDLDGKYGSLKWDEDKRRVYFDITEFRFDNRFEKELGSSVSEDERLGLVAESDNISYLTFKGQVTDYSPDGLGIVEAGYKNGDTAVIKGAFPGGYADGRLTAQKTNAGKQIYKIYFGADDSKLDGGYLYIDYVNGIRLEGNYENGAPKGKQRKCLLNDDYLYGYEIIEDNYNGLNMYDEPIKRLISFYEAS